MIAAEQGPSAEIARHSIVVERERTTGHVESVRFVCHGGNTAACHWWPACGCETWGEADHYGHDSVTPAPGHERVQQPSCWIDPWFNDALSDVQDWLDAYEDQPGPTFNEDGEDTLAWLVSGYIETTFEGEYMTWDYAAASKDQSTIPPGMPTT